MLLNSNGPSIHEISKVIDAFTDLLPLAEIESLLIDSRQPCKASYLFFALKTSTGDGHNYIKSAYNKGILFFVVNQSYSVTTQETPNAFFLKVPDTLKALQTLASYKREKLKNATVVGITGSNGKTVVKDWLFQLLNAEYKSPLSYNSQIGVPLSIYPIPTGVQGPIFIEAGISQKNEMAKLQEIIKPEVGILCSLGSAHSKNFSSLQEKLQEKLILFKGSKLVIGESKWIKKSDFPNAEVITLSIDGEAADVQLTTTKKLEVGTEIYYRLSKHLLEYRKEQFPLSENELEEQFSMVIPFQDQASIHNSSTCLTYALCNQVDLQEFKKAFQFLEQVDMRMQLIAMDKGFIINDTYSNDLDSLKAALEFQSAQAGKLPKALIISDLLDNKLSNKKLYSTIANWIKDYGISQVITVGNEIKVLESLGIPVKFHAESTAKLPKELIAESIKAHATLIKGARVFGLEQLVKQWHKSSHSTNLEIDLDALKHNLSYFRTLITPKRKLMVMLKAFAYGAGMETLSNLLEFNNVDYAGVAYTNEGVQLRKNGFTRPIMVMNPEMDTINELIDYELEPAIYSLDFIQEFTEIISKKDIKTYPIHLKLETGMHRLGVSQAELEEVLDAITQKPSLKVQSIYSHLSVADHREEDDYTRKQIQLFNNLYDISVKKLSYKPIKHLANTAGMTNFPKARYDMCRLGIGLFGYDGNINTILQPVCKFTAKISKINRIKSHESVGYGRRFIATQNEEIAVIPVGYADGLDRKLGNGHGYVLINGKKAPFVGNICMDMSMIQVTNLDAQVGMEVELFGPNLKIEEVAQVLDTIPYELLTRVSQRVKRVYHRT